MHYKFYCPLLFTSGYFSLFVSICFDFTVQVSKITLTNFRDDRFCSFLNDYILLANFKLETLIWKKYITHLCVTLLPKAGPRPLKHRIPPPDFGVSFTAWFPAGLTSVNKKDSVSAKEVKEEAKQ